MARTETAHSPQSGQTSDVRDEATVQLVGHFFRYPERATRHADGDVPNLLWKARLKAS
jgi:hypothetical protein